MNCGDCKYSHDTGLSLLCWGEKEAPPVDPDHWCKYWKPKSGYVAWTSPRKSLPEPFVSVQVYIPSQAPFPTVHEGYVLADDNGIPYGWFIPALRDRCDLYDAVEAWMPFVAPEAVRL